MESLKRLSSIKVEVCAFDHYGVFVGEQAEKTLQRGLEQAEEFRNRIIKQYQQIGDLDEMAQKLAAEILEKNKLDFLSLELETTVAKAVIRKILG
jgi:hypothetical protein